MLMRALEVFRKAVQAGELDEAISKARERKQNK